MSPGIYSEVHMQIRGYCINIACSGFINYLTPTKQVLIEIKHMRAR